MATVKLTITTNFKAASEEIKKIGTLTKEQAKSVERFQKKFTTKQIENFALKTKRLTAAITATRGPLEAAIQKKAALRREIERLIRGGINPENVALGKLKVDYIAASKEADRLTRSTKRTASAFKSTMGNTVAMTAKITGAYFAIRGLATSFAGAYRESRDFSKEIKNVTTLTDALSFDQIKKGIQELDPVLGSAAEKTAGLYQAISAGVAPAKAIEFVGEAAQFAIAGITDTATSVDVLTTALNAYGLEAEQAGKISDSFFKTVEAGKITGAELAASIGKSIPLYAAAGVGLDELNAGFATLTLTGTKAEEAATQLNAVVTGFLKPSKRMSELLKEQGHASGGALLKAEGLAGALNLVKDATGGNLDAMSELMPNIRGLRGSLGLLSQDGNLYKETLDKIIDSSGATEKAFGKQIDAIDLASAQVRRAKENFGEFLEKGLIFIAPALEKIAEAAAGVDFGAVAVGISSMAVAMVGAKVATIALSAGMAGLKVAMISTGIGAIIVAVGALAVGIYKLIKNWDVVKEYIARTAVKLGSIFSIVSANMKMAFLVAWNAIKIGAMELAKIIANRVLGTVEKLLEVLGKLPFVGEKFLAASKSVKNFSEALGEGVLEAQRHSASIIRAAKDERDAAVKYEKDKMAELKRAAAERRRWLAMEAELADKAFDDAGIKPPEILADAPPTGGGGGDDDAAKALAAQYAAALEASQQAGLSQYELLEQQLNARLALLKAGRKLELSAEIENKDKILEYTKAIDAEDRRIKEAKFRFDSTMAAKTAGLALGLASTIIQLAKNLGANIRALAIVEKTIAIARAGINTALGVSAALGGAPPPLNFINAALVGLAGGAQVAAIATTPIPSAQTGGVFEIPPSSSSATAHDNIGVMASPGEQISVTPRGESLDRRLSVTVQLDSQTLLTAVQDMIDSGEILITTKNIQEVA